MDYILIQYNANNDMSSDYPLFALNKIIARHYNGYCQSQLLKKLLQLYDSRVNTIMAILFL